MSNNRRSYIFALLAIACWSTIGSAFKLTLRYTDFLHLIFYSSMIAVVLLFVIIVAQGKQKLLLSVTRKQLRNSAFLGLLNPFLYYVVLLKGYELLPAQEAGTLNYIWPLVLVLLSIPLLHQKISRWSIIAILISFLGIIIIPTQGRIFSLHFSDPFGVLLATGSAVFWALYWIFNIRDDREEVTKLFLNFCFGFLYILILMIILAAVDAASFSIPPIAFAGAVYIGFFEMGITFVLWLLALKYASTTAKVSNLIYISPFISLIFIHFFVGEAILPSTIVGLVFIVGGILLQQRLKS